MGKPSVRCPVCDGIGTVCTTTEPDTYERLVHLSRIWGNRVMRCPLCYGKTLVTDEQNAAYLLLYGCEDWMAIAYDLITELRKSFSKRP